MVDVNKAALEAARIAGDYLLNKFEEPARVEYKDDGSPITTADRECNKIILDCLAKTAIPIVSEESISSCVPARRYWLLDPLDGTKEFIAGNAEFTINIALIEDNYPVLGVVHAPALGELYMGKKGEGSWLIENGTEQQIGRKGKFDSIRIAVSRYHTSEDLDLFVQQNRVSEIITMGSALKYCRLAKGDVELSPRLVGSSEWDTAAAQAVLEATGGLMIDWHTKQSLIYGKEKWCNPRFLAMRFPYKTEQFILQDYKEGLLSEANTHRRYAEKDGSAFPKK